MVGHLGDGYFHVILPYDPAKKEMYERIREFNDLLIKKQKICGILQETMLVTCILSERMI